jgi:hypothetical protein
MTKRQTQEWKGYLLRPKSTVGCVSAKDIKTTIAGGYSVWNSGGRLDPLDTLVDPCHCDRCSVGDGHSANASLRCARDIFV